MPGEMEAAGERPSAPETTEGTAETTAEATTGDDGEEAAEGESGGRPPTLAAGAPVTTQDGLLKDHRMVSFYGNPLSPVMGELGQYPPEEMMRRLEEQAAAYTELTPEYPAVPTIELIASVAQPTPGQDGDYLRRMSPEAIEEYASLAEEHDAQLILDVQIGHSSVAEEIEAIRPFLERPYVHLAIDPEWDMGPGEIPGQVFGSTPAREIKQAARTLSRIVEEEDIPPKVMVVHQFRYDLIVNKEALTPTQNVQTVIHADGFGLTENKFSKY